MTQQTGELFVSAPFGSSPRGAKMEETTGSVKGAALEPRSLETASPRLFAAAPVPSQEVHFPKQAEGQLNFPTMWQILATFLSRTAIFC